MITEQVMTTQEVADRLSQLFKEYKWTEVHEELFSDDAQSIEPPDRKVLKQLRE